MHLKLVLFRLLIRLIMDMRSARRVKTTTSEALNAILEGKIELQDINYTTSTFVSFLLMPLLGIKRIKKSDFRLRQNILFSKKISCFLLVFVFLSVRSNLFRRSRKPQL